MSARPGRIKEVVDIDIPYPRDQETKMSERFIELKNYIWGQVYQEYLEVRKQNLQGATCEKIKNYIPRDQETKMSERFIELKNYIWGQVYQEYLEVRKQNLQGATCEKIKNYINLRRIFS